jgi:hypothetical protein
VVADVGEPLRVYLATDDNRVIEEAASTYPDVIFISSKSISGLSSGEGPRKGIAHTENVLSDVFHLAKTDFFVGTASSQVTRYRSTLLPVRNNKFSSSSYRSFDIHSRMAYERQQTYALDRHNWRAFISLDAPWYFP